MLRRALLSSLAVTGILGGTDALAAQSTIAVRGDVPAIAFAGDSLIAAHQPSPRKLSLERLTPGAPAQLLMQLPRLTDDGQLSLAASAQALAVSLQPDGGDSSDAASHVYVGAPSGPLREVASCPAGLLLSPVAVSGARIAWREGGCGEPSTKPRAVGPSAIVIGAADPGTAVRRVAVADDQLPASLVLNGASGLAGLLRPSFFSIDSEVRPLGTGGLGASVATEQGRIVAPAGILSNGDGAFQVGSSDSDEEDSDSSSACDTTLFVLTPGASARRTLAFGGCPVENGFAIPAARVAADRVYSLITEKAKKHSRAPTPMALASVGGDGSGARIIARGTYRPPQAFAASESGRVAWTQRSCSGGSEIVVDDGAPPATTRSSPACTVKLLTRRAHVRGSRVTLKLRCRSGCSARVIGETRPPRYLRFLTFKRGTHSLRLHLSRKERRLSRLRLSFEVIDGPSLSATVRLR